MSNKKINILIKIYKRNINTDVLYNAMQKIQNNTILQQAKSIKKEEMLEKMAKLKEKVEIKKDIKSYETIQENLNESLRIMKELNKNFKNIKEKSINIEIKVEDTQNIIKQDKIDNLNNNINYNKDVKANLEITINNKNQILENNETIDITSSKLNKSIFDIDWLQPFLDFMHNHSTLVLTIGSGLVMGGMWYMNNIGYINIGSLLTRLGISIFAPNSSQNSGSITMPGSSNSGIITIPSVSNSGNTPNSEEIGRGFFRQLGEKVLKLIDALIVKLESKQQKYK